MNTIRALSATERNVQASLYVGNLDPQVDENLLFELFLQVAPIRLLNLPKDRILRAHQGYGFVEFKTVDDADYAIQIFRGVRLFGRTVKLNKMDSSSAKLSKDAESNLPASVGAKVFIKGLDQLVDERYLHDTFSSFGNLLKCTVLRDEKGYSKGLGLVEYDDFENSDRAIQAINGTILMNNKVHLDYAYKRGFESKKVKHGDEAERKLAKQAKIHLAKGNKRNA